MAARLNGLLNPILRSHTVYASSLNYSTTLDGSLPANPVNDRRKANAVTLKSTFCLP